MHILDWSIIIIMLLVLTITALFTKRYTRSVADFLAANRCAGRYLISVSALIAGFGALSFIGFFESYYVAGFPPVWWQLISLIQGGIIAISGWVAYRYRQTRVMTLGQFIEIRYSRKLRLFAGMLGWFAGIVNFGIFPAVGARFFIYFCGLPDTTLIYASIMLALLVIAVFFTFLGGHIAVIITDFLQGTFCNFVLVILMIFIISKFSWAQVTEALVTVENSDSLLNPFSAQKTQDFNMWFYLIIAFLNFYGAGVWQSHQGYNVCAINAHEARMGGILNSWRWLGMFLAILIMAIAAHTFMNHPDYAAASQGAKDIIAAIDNPTIQKQVTTPMAIRFFLPVGLMGAFVAVILAAFITTHDTMLHSWGSMFVQDIIIPLRKKPFEPKQHMMMLRLSIILVAAIIFLFSLLFRQTEYIHYYFAISASIFIGGGGAVLIGGLYWKRGTTAAAFIAFISGATFAIIGIIIRQVNSVSPFEGKIMSFIASQDPVTMSFYNTIIAIAAYIFISLVFKKPAYNLDKMLHRGEYKIKETQGDSAVEKIKGWRKWIGMGNEFNFKDKLLYIATMGWTAFMCLTFIIVTTYNIFFDVKIEYWSNFWRYYIIVILAVTIVTTIWFAIGGFIDLKRMIKLLGSIKRNDLDDGSVTDHHNLGEQLSGAAELPIDEQD